MQTDSLITQAEDFIFRTYKRSQIILESGKGMYLYDTQGKEYLDFGAGVAVCALGYGHKDFNEILKKQIDSIIHTSNLFYNIPSILAAQKLCEMSQMDKVFFTNSGTEANEGAIKVAKKYMIHDESNSVKVGDEVFIKSSRPISKRKTWVIANNKED